MAMQTIFFKGHEGHNPNTIGQLSSVPSGPWWSAFGSSQPLFGESCGQVKPFSIEQPGAGGGGGGGGGAKEAARGADLGLERGNTKHFTIFPGNSSSLFSLLSIFG